MSYSEYPSYSCPETGLYARVYNHKYANYSVLLSKAPKESLMTFATDGLHAKLH